MLSDDTITQLTNGFVRAGLKAGFASGTEDKLICLFRHNDGWSLEVARKSSDYAKDALAAFDFPRKLPDDELDAAIELASLISHKLHFWSNSQKAHSAAKKYHSSLTTEQRRERAKKAVAARIAKYGQKSKQ